MRMVFGLVLLVGIALAGGAVFLAKDRISQYQAAHAQAQQALGKCGERIVEQQHARHRADEVQRDAGMQQHGPGRQVLRTGAQQHQAGQGLNELREHRQQCFSVNNDRTAA